MKKRKKKSGWLMDSCSFRLGRHLLGVETPRLSVVPAGTLLKHDVLNPALKCWAIFTASLPGRPGQNIMLLKQDAFRQERTDLSMSQSRTHASRQGRDDNSPALQCWDSGWDIRNQSRQGRLIDEAFQRREHNAIGRLNVENIVPGHRSLAQRCPLIALLLALLFLLPLPAVTAPAIIITPTSSAGSPLLINENGSQALVSVVLAALPTGAVQVLLVNPDPGEVALTVATLNFTPANWNQPRIVFITGVDDGLVDGDQPVAIAVNVNAPGTNYSGLSALPIAVRNLDRQIPGLVGASTGGLTELFEGGSGDTVTVALAAQPASDVTVAVTGDGSFTLTPASLIFTNGNWNTPRTITLNAVDDPVVNGLRQVLVSFSASGSGYDGTAASLPLTLRDNDVAGVEVTPLNGLITNESGLQAQVRMRLTSQPAHNVTVPLSSSHPDEGSVSPVSLTFTPDNWNYYQTVILSGVPDGIADADASWDLETGLTETTDAITGNPVNDAVYNLLNPPDATVVNRNTDLAAMVVTPGSVVVTRGGGTAVIQVSLATQPAGDVTVSVVPSNAGILASVDKPSLLFTSGVGGNWNTPQNVVVTGMPSLSPGDQGFSVTFTPSGDAAYAALTAIVVTGVNQDLNLPTVVLGSLSPLTLTEGSGATARYTVRLSTDPGAATIVVTLLPEAGLLRVLVPAALPPNPLTLTFDHDNYSTPQTVTVEAVDDEIAQGRHSGQIGHTAAGSSYQSMSLIIPINDNDQAGISATPLTGLMTTEIGGATTFTVRLTSQPTAPVSISLTSSDPSQGTVSPASLTFTDSGATAWNLPRTVTVTGADGNDFDDGEVPYEIRLGPANSSDTHYHLRVGSPVGLVNLRVDNPPTIQAIADISLQENAGIQIIPLSGISDGQAGENQMVTVTASSDNVTLTGLPVVEYFSPAATGTVTFTPALNTFGDAIISVQVFDGITTVTRHFQVQVHWVNQLPVMARNTPLVVGYRGTGIYQGFNADPAAPGQMLACDVETAAGALLYQVELVPAGGYLQRGGERLVNGATFTQAEISAGRLSYTHEGAPGLSDGFVINISDPDGGVSDTVVVMVTIDRRAPSVDLLPEGSVTWTEWGPPVAIAATALVSDLDSPHFNTGSCVVDYSAGGRDGDLLAVRHIGDGAGQIGVAGAQVRWSGTPIGLWSGGTWPTPLSISFNIHATPPAVQALLRQITFAHSTRDPHSTPRTLQVVISDEAGHACPPQPRTVALGVINDAPVALPVDVATVTDVAVAGQLVVDDLDGPSASFIIVTQPGRGRLTSFNTITGAFIYLPDPGESGLDQFTVRVNDGWLDSLPGTVTLHITGAHTPRRLWFISDPPLEAQAGTLVTWTARVDGSELDAVMDLHFSLEDAPVGMQLVPDVAAGTALVTWPAAVGVGNVRFRLRATDKTSYTADVQSVVIYVHPMPGGGG